MPDSADPRPWLLVIAGGGQVFREYLFRSIAGRYRIHSLDAAEPGWQRPYLEDHTVLPDTGRETVRAAARQIAARRPVAGVLTWHEEHVVQAALAAADLGLPGPGVRAAEHCRDKYLTRSVLTARGLPQPDFALAGGIDEARAAAARIGYPVVVKPRASGGSMGVVLASDEDELAAHFPQTRAIPFHHTPDYERPVLIERYLTGPEISVDSVVRGGRVTPLYLARKQTGFAPYFEETGHQVAHPDPWLSDPALTAALTQVHEAVGFADGWTHSEFRLTDEGPALVEINGRIGGDLIPYLGLRTTGIDPGLTAAAVACGEPANLTATRSGHAGIRFFYPPEGTVTLRNLSFAEDTLPAEIDRLTLLFAPGDQVTAPANIGLDRRVALATALSDTETACRTALDAAGKALQLEAVPTTPEEPTTSGTTITPPRNHGHGHQAVLPQSPEPAPERGLSSPHGETGT